MTTMMIPTLILTQAVANWSQANAASDANKSGWHDPASALPSSIVIIFVIRIVIIVGVIIIVVIIVAACTTLPLHHCHHRNLTKIIFINIVVIITFKF